VEKIADHVAEAAAACPAGALITDAGSIKGQILAKLELRHPAGLPRGVQFVGAHPMAGGDKSGPEHARPDLFQNSACIVTPHESLGPRPLRAATTFWKSLGCRVVPMTADQHDSVVAAVSHVPHLVAAALAGMARAGDREVVGSGWQDMTRIAAGSADLWRQILSGNRSAVLKSLDKFEKLLNSFREALESEDDARLEQLLAAGRNSRLALERPQASSRGHGSRNT
jgi:prephenate dehydrogenase